MFERTGDSQLLDEALTAVRAALAVSQAEHPETAMYLNNLSGFLKGMYERTGDRAVLDELLASAQAAAAMAPAGHAHLGRYLGNLATAQREMYNVTDDEAMLAQALSTDRAAVAAVGDDDPDRPMLLSNLTVTLLLGYLADESEETLTEAVSSARQAVLTCPADHPDLARYQLVLAESLIVRSADYGDGAALAQAREVLGAALSSPNAQLRLRIDAGQWKARADLEAGDSAAALDTVRAVIGLMPLLAPRALRRTDRQFRLGDQPGVGSQAAAAALAAGEPETAVELLEQARGLLLAETMGTRSEAAKVSKLAPDLADKFQELRAEFTSMDSGQPGDERLVGDRRRKLASDWDELVHAIRARPGLASFLRPQPVGDLARCAAGGAIVMVTADESRCDALIVTSDQARPVRTVALAGLTAAAAQEQATAFLAACEAALAGSTTAEARILRILEWLWDTVAEPVLLELGYADGPADDQWPRLWWCPVGPMAFLPLHAAGYHDGEATPGASVLDRVVSSYTATIQALAYSRSRPSGPDLSSALIVGLPLVDGAPELPGVRAEISTLSKFLPDRTLLEGATANKNAVLDALPAHAIAHFACHSLSDADDPGSSSLMLSDYADAPLTVAAIAGLELAKARFAYLSSCATSRTTASLADEAVHITSAFQLAGYPQVIGTLWPVLDSVARAVALDVYGQLTGEGAAEADPAPSALALHRAIRRVRASRRRRPSSWASYVHVGANPVDPAPEWPVES